MTKQLDFLTANRSVCGSKKHCYTKIISAKNSECQHQISS